MANKDDISVLVLVRPEPITKIISSNFDSLVCLIARIDLGMNGVGILQGSFEITVYVSGERAE